MSDSTTQHQQQQYRQQQHHGRGSPPGLGFPPLRPNQAQVLGNLNRVREMVTAEMSKLDQQRVNEFLNACCEGNEYRIKKVSGGWFWRGVGS